MGIVGNKKNYKFIVLSFILVLSLSLAGCSSGDKEVVGKVNDDVITKGELYDLLVEQGGAQALDSLIFGRIIEAEAKKEKIKISNDEIQKEIDKMVEENGGESQFNLILSYEGLTMDDLKENISLNLKIRKLLTPSISITEAEMEEFFEKNKASFNEEEQVKASHILVETEEEAKDILDKLNKGGDFAELAKEKSKDGSAQVGGDLGFFGKGEMVKEFEETSFALAVGETSEIVKTTHGYHIIRVTEKKEAKEAVYADHKEVIEEEVFSDKISLVLPGWYQERLGQYDIVNKLTKEG